MFAAFAGAAACASNQGSASTPVATARELGELPQPKWVASIRANVTDRLAADSTRERMNGSLVWMPSGSPDMSTARIEFAYTGSARELTWGIFFGPCGNASLPVVTLSDFPELEMSSGGRTQLVASVSTELPTTGAFHVEIFKDRSGLPEFSIACGNMRFSRG
jgi:hypothetical protein